MARVSENTFPLNPYAGTDPGIFASQLGMSLDRYAEVMELDMCAFNGINKRGSRDKTTACDWIMGQSARDKLAKFLLQAEQKREEWLVYHLGAKWTISEEHPLDSNPFILKWKNLVQMGLPTLTMLEEGVAVVKRDVYDEIYDPVVFTIDTEYSLHEVVVTYPGEEVQIRPTKVTKTGNTVTIEIPRCRLVKPEYNDDWADPPTYDDDDVFLDTVDIHRLYADVTQAVQYEMVSVPCSTAGACATQCITGCATIDDFELAIVNALPATLQGSKWIVPSTDLCTCGYRLSGIKFNYLSGMVSMSNEIYTIRLAHTLMSSPPCACAHLKKLWEDDSEVLTNTWTTYGSKRGAVDTWMADRDKRKGGGGMFPGMRDRHVQTGIGVYPWA